MYPNNKFNQICKLFCLAPISSNPHIQRWLSAYSGVTICALVLDILFSFTINILGDGYVVSSLVTSAVFLSVLMGHIVAVVESLVKRENQEEFFIKLEEVDCIFRFKLRHKIQSQTQQRKLLWKYAIISFIVLFNLCCFIWSVFTYDYKGFFWYAIVSLIVSRMRLIQASVYMELINYRFDNLNLLLKQISNYKLQRKNRILDIDVSAIDSPERIFTLKSVYAKLLGIVDCSNDTFGWSILAFVVYFSLDFTCNSYWSFLSLENYVPSFHKFEGLTTLIPIGIVLGLYCHISYECVSKGDITKQLLQKMLVSTTDDHTKYLLNEFLLHIHHQPIVVHAKRFFRIDLKLLSSICASIVGYLVILIQFRNTENEL